MGGGFSWLWILQAMLIGSLFFAANFYLWLGMERIPGAERYAKLQLPMMLVLTLGFVVWATPRSIIATGAEMAAMGGSHHPVLGLFGYDLKDVIQPWALLLNGLTAISGAIAFWRAGMVDGRGALILVIITTIGAPVGVWLLQFASTDLVWWLYVGVLVFLAIRMALPKGASTEVVAEITDAARARAAGAAVPISVFAGFLGVGPGFLLMPTLTLVGYSARLAAATNSVAVTLPSFSAFVTHLPTATFDWPTVIITSIAAVSGAWLGARFTAGRVKSATLSRIFAVALVRSRPTRSIRPSDTTTNRFMPTTPSAAPAASWASRSRQRTAVHGALWEVLSIATPDDDTDGSPLPGADGAAGCLLRPATCRRRRMALDRIGMAISAPLRRSAVHHGLGVELVIGTTATALR
jgi:uncharacterized membrane protein YfcA